MKSIFRTERLIVLGHSGPVAIVSAYAPAVKLITTANIAEKYATVVKLVSYLFSSGTTSRHSAEHKNDGISAHITYRITPLVATSELIKSRLTLPASGMVDTVPYKSFRILISNFSTKRTSLPLHMLVAVGSDLSEMVLYFRAEDISTQNESEEKSVDLPSEKMGNLNAESTSRKCRKGKVDVLSVLRNWQIFEKLTDSVESK